MGECVSRGHRPRILVEVLDHRNVPKNKTDDKQLRQAQIGPIVNDGSLAVLEIILEDGTVERYNRPAGGVLAFIQLDQGP